MAKFITLTGTYGEPVIINIDHIVLMEPGRLDSYSKELDDKLCTKISVVGHNDWVKVHEELSEVTRLLMGAQGWQVDTTGEK